MLLYASESVKFTADDYSGRCYFFLTLCDTSHEFGSNLHVMFCLNDFHCLLVDTFRTTKGSVVT